MNAACPAGSGSRRRRTLAFAAIAATTGLTLAVSGYGEALAQSPPPFFAPPGGTPRPPASSGLTGYILDQQAQFYRQLSQTVRSVKAGDQAAFWSLVGLSFLYGVFHAAGPGHGKAVISSYIISTGETVRRGIWLSTISAFAQAVTAIVLVSVLALIVGATARTMSATVRWIEIAAYALVIVIGLRLIWTKSRAFLVRWQSYRSGRPVAGMQCDDGCVHLPPAEQIARLRHWRDTLAIVLAVGLRPCTGAILVLIFARAQGILSAGVVATFAMAAGTAATVAALAALAAGAKGLAVRFASSRTGVITLGLSLIEVLAAGLVALFGAALLTGYLAVERTMPF